MSYFKHIQQEVITSTINSSISNINAGDTWSGTGESTLGIVGIQVNFIADQNCTVYIDQSMDNSNWDITDTYNYYTMNGGWSTTVQATASYLRIRIKNISSTNTTSLRLQTALCPIVEAVPRSLDENGHFKTTIHHIEDEYGFGVENTPMGEMRTVSPFRMVGTVFNGNYFDTTFWTSAATGTASSVVVSGGLLALNSGTDATGIASCTSVRKARYIAGVSNRYRAQMSMDAANANNLRRWGVYTGEDGVYFELSGTTLYVGTRIGSADTKVASTSWSMFRDTPNIANVNTYEIYYTNKKAYFSINDELVHVVAPTTSPWSATKNLPIKMETINVAGSTSYALKSWVASICRLGPEYTDPIYKYISTTGTYLLKVGAGKLRFLIAGDNVGTISVYDDLSAVVANQMGLFDLTKTTGPFEFNCPFFNGLTIVTTSNAKVTVIFE